MKVTALYCKIDDFYKRYLPSAVASGLLDGKKHRHRSGQMYPSEIMTIIVLFHGSHYRHFKVFYQEHVQKYMSREFPHLLSYSRFVRHMSRVLAPLCAYLETRKGTPTGIYYVDSTPVAVCKNKRITRHKTFAGFAARGKTSMGWFFGFKLHLIINEIGELLAFQVTPGNIDDRKPLQNLSKHLTGKLFGDKGYISKSLSELLLKQGLQLFTTLRTKMKNCLLSVLDKILLRKRFLIETVNDQLKNISQIEHSRHRSSLNFMVNLVAGLIAYTHQEKKTSLRSKCKFQTKSTMLAVA